MAKQKQGTGAAAKHPDADNTRAERPQATGLTRPQLAVMLAKKKCEHCGQRSWKVERTVGRVRYLTCKGCSRPNKIAISNKGQEVDVEREEQIQEQSTRQEVDSEETIDEGGDEETPETE